MVYWNKIVAIASFGLCLISCGPKEPQLKDLIVNPHSASDFKDEELPQFEFEEMSFDFGVISQGEKVSHTFQYKNTGKSPGIIFDVQSDCGCTSPRTWKKTPIAPGETGTIVVDFDSEGKAGELTRTVRVATSGEPSIVQLKIKAEIIVPNQLQNLINSK